MAKNPTKKFKKLIRLINWYPPFFFSGIKVVDHSSDFRRFKTRLQLTWFNRNLVGTAFGGSLYSMCDPFFMFILIANLGDDYLVWDKHASIDFIKPGKGTVFAEFEISKKQLLEIKEKVNELGKFVFDFPCEVKSESGEVIVRVQKGVYVRKKSK